jgi:hypothetical protein
MREAGLAGLLRSKNSQNRTYGLMREGRREPALYSTRIYADFDVTPDFDDPGFLTPDFRGPGFSDLRGFADPGFA